jgi:hypothetical protein
VTRVPEKNPRTWCALHRSSPRAAIAVLLATLLAIAIVAPVAAGRGPGWDSLALEMAAPWPSIQEPAGNLPDYLDGIVGQPPPVFAGTRYGDAMMGLGLMQVGTHQGNEALTRAGIRAVTYATAVHGPSVPGQPSVFENWAVAEAYDLARRLLAADPQFQSSRAQWEDWLRHVKTMRLPIKTRYGNHWLVEANGVAALLRTGLTSDVPGTVLGGGRALAASDLLHLVNERIPRMARGRGPFVLSDPPDNPAAYQALSLGLYGHLVAGLGPQASTAARRTLLRIARASWLMAAPDGDQAYFGRSQEQVWTYTAAAYGAEVAAGLTGGARAARYRGLAERSIAMLRRNYPIGPRGQLIVPALAHGLSAAGPGLDTYAGAPSMGGIALAMLNFAIERSSTGELTRPLAADAALSRRLSAGRSTFAVVRAGRVWYAVKLKGSRQTRWRGDLRYDFGLIAGKLWRRKGWTDVVPLRPRTISTTRDSTGPRLITRSGRIGFPDGRSMRFTRRGATRMSALFRTASGHSLRRVTFRYAPTRCGVSLSFRARRGDRYELSYFFEGGTPRLIGSRALRGRAQGVRANIPFRARFELSSASAADVGLIRARLTISVRRERAIRVTAC